MTGALRLFSTQGFRGTTVGEIEAAAGLSPRAGAFYRHFDSKVDVLHAAVRRQYDSLAGFKELRQLLPLGDLHSELTLIVRWALQRLREQQDLLRLLQRDADQYPEFLRNVHETLVAPAFDQMVAIIADLVQRHGRAGHDAASAAAIALGAIVHYCDHRALYGVAPADVDEDRFVETWVEVWTRYVRGADVLEPL